MKYRKLGQTELNVSVIALGCSGYWGQPRFSEQQAHAVVREAFERGVNFFDTGHNYSQFNAEPRLGRVIRELLKNHNRSRLIISTKAGTVVPSTSIIPAKRGKQKDFSPDAIETSCVKSLANLHCDYLDIFQLHGISSDEVTDGLLNRLSRMKEKGMYRYLGINTHSEADMLFVSQHPEIFDIALIDYNLLQLDREPVINTLSSAGIGVVAGTVLAQGHLVRGKIGSIKSYADIWYLARALLKTSSRRLLFGSRGMKDILNSIPGMTAAQAAFAYVLQNPSIVSCVFGTTRINNLIEVLSATDMTLTEEKLLAIRLAFTKLTKKVSQ